MVEGSVVTLGGGESQQLGVMVSTAHTMDIGLVVLPDREEKGRSDMFSPIEEGLTSPGPGQVRPCKPPSPPGNDGPPMDNLDIDMAGDELSDPVELIARLEAEERELILARFDHDDAWRLGLLLVGLARARDAAVTIDIRRGRQQLFHYALPGTSPDNDAWIRRKSRIVTRFGASSYLVGLRHRLAGRTSADETGLNPRRYAAYGGSFPLTVAGVGVVGAVTVSGLPQADDHRLVVEALRHFAADQHRGAGSTP